MYLSYEHIAGRFLESPDLSPTRAANIRGRLLPAAWALQRRLMERGLVFEINPKTGTIISGTQYGGFRPQDCPEGAPHSNHKEGLAVDVFDPGHRIDGALLASPTLLDECGVWIEHPDVTIVDAGAGWSHWQCVPPRSGRRMFYP